MKMQQIGCSEKLLISNSVKLKFDESLIWKKISLIFHYTYFSLIKSLKIMNPPNKMNEIKKQNIYFIIMIWPTTKRIRFEDITINRLSI